MTKFKAEIDVMPLKALLDPQGKAVASSLQKIGFSGVQEVRIGKHITVELEAADKKSAEALVDKACRDLLANLIMESYHFEVKAI
jgi:phosphoribosylformylglycinamidine synthase PurS subunit